MSNLNGLLLKELIEPLFEIEQSISEVEEKNYADWVYDDMKNVYQKEPVRIWYREARHFQIYLFSFCWSKSFNQGSGTLIFVLKILFMLFLQLQKVLFRHSFIILDSFAIRFNFFDVGKILNTMN